MRVISFLLLLIGTIFLFLFAFRINFEGWNTLGLGLFFWILTALLGVDPEFVTIPNRQPPQ